MVQGAKDIVAVTKSNTVPDPNGPFKGFVYSGAGDIKVTTSGGDRVIPSGLLALNVEHELKFSRVWDTGTTATGIYGIK